MRCRATLNPNWLPHRRTFIRFALVLCFAFTIVFPCRTWADVPPKFADPDATAYLIALGQFRDRYVAAVKAARHGDHREIKRLDAAFPEMQSRAVLLLEKLKPDETKSFTDYVNACGQTMVDAAYGLGGHPG